MEEELRGGKIKEMDNQKHQTKSIIIRDSTHVRIGKKYYKKLRERAKIEGITLRALVELIFDSWFENKEMTTTEYFQRKYGNPQMGLL